MAEPRPIEGTRRGRPITHRGRPEREPLAPTDPGPTSWTDGTQARPHGRPMRERIDPVTDTDPLLTLRALTAGWEALADELAAARAAGSQLTLPAPLVAALDAAAAVLADEPSTTSTTGPPTPFT